MLHSYPSLEKVAEIRDAHDARILNSCVSPNGDVIVTNSGDENIKFWRIWEQPTLTKKRASRKENSGAIERELRSIR
jgi:cell division cycle protein 20 (cofactor of APC complex)